MADVGSPAPAWHVSGAYLESCNCEAICPCRMVDGVPGGRSTFGICFGALSWQIEDGRAGELPLDSLAVALTYTYDDDESGSPWQFVLHVDERGSEQQRRALADIFLGRLGGEGVLALPWVRKVSDLLAVRASRIEIEHGSGGHELRIGGAVSLRTARPVQTDQRVSCIVPGHHRAGTELYAEVLEVRDEPFEWELAGNCAFVADFAYSSSGSG